MAKTALLIQLARAAQDGDVWGHNPELDQDAWRRIEDVCWDVHSGIEAMYEDAEKVYKIARSCEGKPAARERK